MHTPNTTDYTSSVTANRAELAEGLFVLELEERLEMAAVTAAVSCDRCDVEL